MSNLKICLIYTGGTIGMQRLDDGTLRPPDDPSDFLKVAPELEEMLSFDFVPLMNKDSTNINTKDWEKIAIEIYNRRKEYRGFVIAHGTDTMHFTASAVAFTLGRFINFPVVFTGAQTTPHVKHGDARINLLRAFKVAEQDLAEVVISFGDYIFRACRAQKKDEKKFDAFESPAFYQLGFITESIVLSPLAKKISTNRFYPDIQFIGKFAPGILQVSLIPGLEPKMLFPSMKLKMCKGIILQSFGAGNVPHEEEYSFQNFIHSAVELDKPVVITSQFPAHTTIGTQYESGKVAVQAGAIPTANMTSSCSVAKFRWALAQIDDLKENAKDSKVSKIELVKEIMEENYIGEMDPPGGDPEAWQKSY